MRIQFVIVGVVESVDSELYQFIFKRLGSDGFGRIHFYTLVTINQSTGTSTILSQIFR